MDPLSALGLAGNLVQFIQFAYDLSKGTASIYNSATGSSENKQHLNSIYSRLFTFSSHLVVDSKNGATASITGAFASKHSIALTALAEDCQAVCNELLKCIENLRIQSDTGGKQRRRWRSFRKALLETWQADKVNELTQRIDRLQSSITLHLCGTSSESIEHLRREMRVMRADAKIHNYGRTQDMINISDILREVESKIEDLRVRQATNPSARLDRRESISTAHRDTLKWIFDTSASDGEEGVRIKDWLQHGHNTFWISGKPGSGKSTLMKFVAQHPETDELLKRWANPKSVIVATHYFWSVGVKVQQSFSGLLRSLMYQVLRQAPSIIARVCKSNDSHSLRDLEIKQWTIDELKDCLNTLANLSDLPFAFCFFVDGLDESCDDHLEVCETLLQLCRHQRIKLCVSSRPWNVFQQHFGKTPSSRIAVQELTKKDIRAYAENRLCEHPQWKTLVSQMSSASNLIEEITNKAQGVFLWVFLVTKLLREGITEGDLMEDLHARLNSFPADLEPFFKLILDSVGPFYHKKMAESLLMVLTMVRKPCSMEVPLTLLAMQEREYGNESYALEQLISPQTPAWFQDQNEAMERRLNGRCKGLLEVRRSNVRFLHRTVRDFLETKPIQDFLAAKSRPTFNPDVSMACAFLCWIKQAGNGSEYGELSDCPDFACHLFNITGLLNITFCLLSTGQVPNSQLKPILDGIETTVDGLFRCGETPIHTSREYFRERVIYFGFTQYLAENIAEDPEYLNGFSRPPLSNFLLGHRFRGTPGEESRRKGLYSFCHTPEFSDTRKATLAYLLRQGCHPNQSYIDDDGSISTSWRDLTTQFIICAPWQDRTIQERISGGYLQALLDAGADPDVCCGISPTQVPFWLRFFFGSFEISENCCISEAQEEGLIEAFRVMLRNSKTLKCMSTALYPRLDKLSLITPWEKLSIMVAAERPQTAHRGDRFLSCIIRELAYYTWHLKSSWYGLEPKLRRLLGPTLVVPILQAAKGNHGLSPRRSIKRKHEIAHLIPESDDTKENDQWYKQGEVKKRRVNPDAGLFAQATDPKSRWVT
ncbi:hypothetical protein F5Y16DRAFT_423439 [Xylariaceae sp. FL0255]|nr:hypothetical protein F5Y16DRAFT_423439 [Xylariaceae sp. FL0255]